MEWQGNLSWLHLKQHADPTLASLPVYPEYETGSQRVMKQLLRSTPAISVTSGT